MLRKTLFLYCCIVFFSPVFAQDNGPIERLTASYERTNDLAFAYHLARVSFAFERYDESARWLSILQQASWQMGIDVANFPEDKQTEEIKRLIVELQSMQLVQSGLGSIPAEIHIDDPMLIPENIAYDYSRGVMYAGSLVKPRIVRVHLNEASRNDDLPLPSNVNWGVIYGMKFHDQRRELWVAHNRSEADRLHGALTVLDVDGQFVKTYDAVDAAPIELNDLCFTKNHVYVTDSTDSKVYRGNITGTTLSLFYENADINYPNGIACGGAGDRVFVSDSRGVSVLGRVADQSHQRLNGEAGISFGGIDGLYLNDDTLIGVQNFIGAPKIITTNIANAPYAHNTEIHDVNRPEFRIPTTGFFHIGCLYYIANSSLDAIGVDGAVDLDAERPVAAKVIALNVVSDQKACEMVIRSGS